MNGNELTYDDFLRRLTIQDVLIDAGYRLNRRDGLRYPSYVRTDSDGRRVRGDKFIVTANGQCCFQPPQQKLYNIISFIKEHPQFFAEYRAGISGDRLVNLVCNRLLNQPIPERETRIIQPRRDIRPFNIDDYDIHKFNPQDKETQKKFYFFFKHRGIDLYTQYAFHRDFCLATRKRPCPGRTANPQTRTRIASFGLAFVAAAAVHPCPAPFLESHDLFRLFGQAERECKVGIGRPVRPFPRGQTGGSGSYKGKAEGSNSSAGLWIGSPAGTALGDATHIYWFESGYDAMSYYQLYQKENKDLRKAVFVSTGGTPTVEQMRGVISRTRSARQHICFDTDAAGREFTDNLKKEIHRIVKSGIESTPERKAYLETIPAGGGIDGGNADLLPDTLRSCYGKYEAAWEEVMSMRSSGLCHPDDIKEQESLMNRQYRDFRNGLRDFLGLDEKDDTRFVREEPKAPCKDWNDELLAGIRQETSARENRPREEDTEQERKTGFHR